MIGQAHKQKQKWVRTIPRSKLIYPKGKREDQLKYVFWRAFTPVHPFFRELCMPVRRLRGRLRRQNYLLGVLHPEHSLEAFVGHLLSLGYRRHQVAWRDPEQVVSMRLLDGFHYQYHLRIFADGEVRGHYEYTPESYPLKHLKKVNMQDRGEEFLRQFGGWLAPARAYISAKT